MRVRVTLPVQDTDEIKKRVLEGAAVVERDEVSEEFWEAVCSDCPSRYDAFLLHFQTLLIDPGQLRVFRDLLDKECKDGRVDTLDHNATASASSNQL
jgi:ribosome maturation protein SDO1